jgi:23S rRNA (uracil1939-C5)-methyltransferase
METIDRDGLGFHIPLLFDKVVNIEHCHLQEDPSNHIRNTIRKYVREAGFGFYEIAQHRGFLRNLIIRTATTGELMIIVQFGEFQEDNISKIMHFIVNAFPELTSLYYIINKKGNETYHDQELTHVHGEKFIIEKIGDFSFRIGPKSFFQTNTYQAEKLYRKAKEMAELQRNETVYDLYTGTGTIANYMADAAGRVVGIEIIDEAIHDARINSEINNIHNTVFLTGDIKDTLNEDLFRQYGTPDVVITDPPRAGMHADVVETILKIKPKKIVYISCNPATQARDLALLCEDYTIKEIQPVDMFPHTHHLENIVSLYLNTHDNNE